MRQKLTKVDEQPAVSLPLVVRHGHDAADVVLLGAVLLLAEVSHQVTPVTVVSR